MKREPTGCLFFPVAQVLTPHKRLILRIRGNVKAVDLKSQSLSLGVCGDQAQHLWHVK